ncbi:MAG: VOC family protein [Planctomycetota bacterium]
MVKAVPDGFRTVTPHLIVNDGNAAIEFYKRAFNAEELCRMPGPEGKVMHAELKIGDSVVMLADEFGGASAAPKSLNGTTFTCHLYVEDADAAFQRAVEAGAQVIMPVTDMFWGDRYGKVKDPFGHEWSVATHTEDLTPEEITQRGAKFMANFESGCPE